MTQAVVMNVHEMAGCTCCVGNISVIKHRMAQRRTGSTEHFIYAPPKQLSSLLAFKSQA